MTDALPGLSSLLEALAARGHEEAEVYWKRGRSRRVHVELGRQHTVISEEEGWAVRAGGRGRSFFAAATGTPTADWPWPEPCGGPLRLPPSGGDETWRVPADLDAPLVGEVEAQGILTVVAAALEEERQGSQLLRGVVEDGSSQVAVANSRGVRAAHRNRLASIRLWACRWNDRVHTAEIYVAAREARRFTPQSLARRLADRLIISERGVPPPQRDRGELLLSPEVAGCLLGGIAPLFVGGSGWPVLQAMADRSGRVASRSVSLVDNGRLAGGLFEAPVDGEGVATREIVLVEEGTLCQPVLPWWEPGGPRRRTSGCRRRASWRTLPETGITHFYLRPSSGATVANLLEQVARGYYFIDVAGPPTFDLPTRRFDLPVLGFEVRGGRAARPITGARLVGAYDSLLRGVQAVGRDLTFVPGGNGAIGTPTLLLSGVEVRAGT